MQPSHYEEKNIQKSKEEYHKQSSQDLITFGSSVANATREELIETFSMKNNKYLKCKWNTFLKNVPKETLKIKSYAEYQKRKDPVRKMILNGSFYLRSGEQIPVPYF